MTFDQLLTISKIIMEEDESGGDLQVVLSNGNMADHNLKTAMKRLMDKQVPEDPSLAFLMMACIAGLMEMEEDERENLYERL